MTEFATVMGVSFIKLEKAYAYSMAVVEDWSSWDVPEHWIEG